MWGGSLQTKQVCQQVFTPQWKSVFWLGSWVRAKFMYERPSRRVWKRRDELRRCVCVCVHAWTPAELGQTSLSPAWPVSHLRGSVWELIWDLSVTMLGLIVFPRTLALANSYEGHRGAGRGWEIHNVPGAAPSMPGFIPLAASFPPSFSVLRVILPSEVGGEHQLSLLSDSFCGCCPEDLDMRTTGMCVLLVCLCTVSPGQGTDASQDEYVDSLSEKSECETAAVHPPGITAPSTDGSNPSLSPGKIRFLSFFDFPLQKLTESVEDQSVTWPGVHLRFPGVHYSYKRHHFNA